jgi:hypothetical protein
MKRLPLQKLFEQRYPDLLKLATISVDHDSVTIELPFHNPRYSGWILQDKNGYIVGINGSHNHYDIYTEEENLEHALDHFEEIINDELVAIGVVKETENFMLAVMPTELGIESYSNEKPIVEIVSFSREY